MSGPPAATVCSDSLSVAAISRRRRLAEVCEHCVQCIVFDVHLHVLYVLTIPKLLVSMNNDVHSVLYNCTVNNRKNKRAYMYMFVHVHVH